MGTQPSEFFAELLVTMPLALGTTLGHPLTAGFRLGSAGSINEGCCISVLGAGCYGGLGLFHEISFAPSSGKCYHQYPAHGPIMSAILMPPLEIDAKSAGEVEAWVRITAE